MVAPRLAPRYATLAALALAVGLAMPACATHTLPATADPAVAYRAAAATAPDRPLRVVFDWRAQEADARFSGRGLARIEPPYHARLDLFGPRGDTYVSAALVGSQVRLPPGARATGLPPAALMWAVLGAVAPPPEATLLGTRERAGDVELHYDLDGSRLRFVLTYGQLRSAHWEGGGRRMTVELRGGATAGIPREAVFRDQVAYTELILNLESVDEVDPFPSEIWTPGS